MKMENEVKKHLETIEKYEQEKKKLEFEIVWYTQRIEHLTSELRLLQEYQRELRGA